VLKHQTKDFKETACFIRKSESRYEARLFRGPTYTWRKS